MVGRLILFGLIIGIAAGLLAFGWARAFGEAQVETAIAFESAHSEAHEEAGAEAAGHHHEAAEAAEPAGTEPADHHNEAAEAAAAEPAGHHHGDEETEIFSRTVQSGIGLLTGLVVVGAGLGCLFAVLFALAYGRIGAISAGPTAALLSALGLLSVYLVPALKYPANPPAVGEPDTIRLRTGLYFLMVAISIAATVVAWMTRRRLLARHGAWNSSVAAVGVYLVVIALAFTVLPTINEVPVGFPADTLWSFRVASIGLQTVLWGSIGVMFGYVGERTMGQNR
ncbi:MAG: CbtA family protein [Gammaproteobacteria bacterium]